MSTSNIVVYRGDEFSMQLEFKDEDGVVIDITGWTIFFTVKKKLDDPDTAAKLSVTVSPTDPTNGIALVTVPNTETDNLSGVYYYDFQFKKADGTIQTLVSGGITFEKDVTRRTT